MPTYNSEIARAELRNILDAAKQGQPAIIARYNRPEAVVIGYEQWEDMQDTIEALRVRLDLLEGKSETISFAEFEAELDAVPA